MKRWKYVAIAEGIALLGLAAAFVLLLQQGWRVVSPSELRTLVRQQIEQDHVDRLGNMAERLRDAAGLPEKEPAPQDIQKDVTQDCVTVQDAAAQFFDPMLLMQPND